jgi:hypothetical protein
MGVEEFVEQPGLADPGFADRRDDLPVAGPGQVQRALERRELGLPAHERGQPTGGSGLEAPARRACPEQLERLDRLGKTLDRDAAQWLHVDQPLDQAQRLDGEAGGPGHGELLHPGGQMGGRADRRILDV